MAPPPPLEIYWLGRVPYGPAADLQERLRGRVQQGGPEALLLCEHEPVITLGHSAEPGDLRASPAALDAEGVARFTVRRGGRATYHGPGQLVVYPIVRLRQGVLAHVVALGEAAAAVAAALHVSAAFRRDPVGVFVGERKLAAIGVDIRRRVTAHGMALHVTAEACGPARRGLLVPCGEPGRALTSLAEESGRALAVAELAGPLAAALCRRLGRPEAPPSPATLDSLLCRLPAVE
jgi:lipoate-protein ligase B